MNVSPPPLKKRPESKEEEGKIFDFFWVLEGSWLERGGVGWPDGFKGGGEGCCFPFLDQRRRVDPRWESSFEGVEQ